MHLDIEYPLDQNIKAIEQNANVKPKCYFQKVCSVGTPVQWVMVDRHYILSYTISI